MSARTVWLGTIVFAIGCGRDQPAVDRNYIAPAAVAETQPAVAETKTAVAETKTAVDPSYVLERLREATANLRAEWGIAQSPLTWSTLTVKFGLPFPGDASAQVWTKWTEPKTALTLEANQTIKSEIEQAVAEAVRKQGNVERAFDHEGFRFVVTASAVPDKDMSFVRLSFKCLEY